MTVPLGLLEIDRILGGGPSAPRIADRIMLGMPHLCLGGLSETWLLRECGHRHWLLLAHAIGQAVPDFRDASGGPVYAAFVAVTIRDARFDAVREHDELVFEAQLARMSHSRFMSVHRLQACGRPIGELMMTSVFVRRTETGSNRSIARVEVAGLPPVAPLLEFVEHQAVFGELRRGSWATHLGFIRSEAATLDRLVVDPCPAQDFNGAEFLYFSSFQAFVDRAEWTFFRPANPRLTTRRRDIVYHGNIEPGEHLAVMLCAVRRQNDGYAHWCRLVRKIDDAPLADVFTLRQD